MFGLAFDIIFAIMMIGGALFKFLTASPAHRKEKGYLLIFVVLLFVAYFYALPPEQEEKSIESFTIPTYLQ